MGRRFTKVLFLSIVVAGVVVSAAAALRFTDDSYNLSEGVVGKGYNHQFKGEAGCDPFFNFRVVNGALPPGLSLSSNGSVSGTPTQSGSYAFWVVLADVVGPDDPWCTNPKTAEREFTLSVLSGLSIETKSLQNKPGSIGVPYSAPLSAMLLTASNPPAGTAASGLTWSVISGALPPGLGITNGVITGTPTTAGSFTFVVQAELDPTRKDTETLQIDVTAALAITATTGIAPVAEVGVPVSAKLGATGGTGTYTWSLAGGALPPGTALAADGTLAGTPTASGIFSFTVGLADSAGRTTTRAVIIPVANRLAISTQLLRAGKVGRLYRSKLATAGGVLPKLWKVTSGPLPRGIRFDRTLGVLSGTPTKPGRYRVTFSATDALKVTSTKTLVINVLP